MRLLRGLPEMTQFGGAARVRWWARSARPASARAAALGRRPRVRNASMAGRGCVGVTTATRTTLIRSAGSGLTPWAGVEWALQAPGSTSMSRRRVPVARAVGPSDRPPPWAASGRAAGASRKNLSSTNPSACTPHRGERPLAGRGCLVRSPVSRSDEAEDHDPSTPVMVRGCGRPDSPGTLDHPGHAIGPCRGV
jgi:hypothetical protein